MISLPCYDQSSVSPCFLILISFSVMILVVGFALECDFFCCSLTIAWTNFPLFFPPTLFFPLFMYFCFPFPACAFLTSVFVPSVHFYFSPFCSENFTHVHTPNLLLRLYLSHYFSVSSCLFLSFHSFCLSLFRLRQPPLRSLLQQRQRLLKASV